VAHRDVKNRNVMAKSGIDGAAWLENFVIFYRCQIVQLLRIRIFAKKNRDASEKQKRKETSGRRDLFFSHSKVEEEDFKIEERIAHVLRKVCSRKT
jgi:hypothetical protein